MWAQAKSLPCIYVGLKAVSVSQEGELLGLSPAKFY